MISSLTNQLINWRYGIQEETVLNAGHVQGETPGIIAEELKYCVNVLKAQAINLQEGRVDYNGLKGSTALDEYRQAARGLQNFDPSQLKTLLERMAFWINLYNALIIDAVITFGVRKSVNEIPGFFWKAAYCINGMRYSTLDIEYGILRANIGHPVIPGPQFEENDPRSQYSLEELDPRIHFALVCAARSCPPIAVYTAEQLDQQLDLAASAFINGSGVEIDRQQGQVWLSKIFQWYAPDFGGPFLGFGDMSPVLEYVERYLGDEDDQNWMKSTKPRIKFSPYDWRLNI